MRSLPLFSLHLFFLGSFSLFSSLIDVTARSYTSSLAAEACFLTVNFLEAEVGKKNTSESCWSNFESGSSSDVNCPFFVLFLVVIVNGLLVLFTTSFLLARLLGSRECSLERIPVCRFIIRYGSFFGNVFTALLVLTFIGLIVDLRSKKNYSGQILERRYRGYFMVVVAGLILVLISLVTTSLLAFKRRRNVRLDDEFEDTISRSYSDRGSFLDING